MSNPYVANQKTTMCTYWETGCPRLATCTFAHSADELLPRMCPHGSRCHFDRRNPRFDLRRRPCGFFHPGECITTEEVFRRATEFMVAKPVVLKTLKTQLCPDLLQCPKDDCMLAHKKEELSPVMCKHGARCYFNPKNLNFDRSRRPCLMHHPGDSFSVDELYEKEIQRLGLQQKLAAQVPQFVVRLDDGEESEEYDYEMEDGEIVEEEPKEPPKPFVFSIQPVGDWLDEKEDYEL